MPNSPPWVIALLEQLRHCVETDIVCRGDNQQDRSALEGHPPGIVVFPTQQADVIKTLLFANQHGIPVVTRGAGTGTTGGAVSATDGIVINLSRMNRIIEIDTKNHCIVVEPGVILETLHQAVESSGLFYPPDPASLSECTIGGNVAENAGGPRCLKYGVTGDYVRGLSGVYANGQPFKLGGKLLKNVAGLDLIHLLIGSEGTLGVITEITLSLIPLPQERRVFLGQFASTQLAIDGLHTLRMTGVCPSAAEFMDRRCVEAVRSRHPDMSLPDADAYLIIELDSPPFSLPDLFTETGPEIWTIRRSISPALKAIGIEKMSHDITVPPAQIANYMTQLAIISEETGFIMLAYGHLGDGNLHVNILRGTHSTEEWRSQKENLETRVVELAVSMGGTITGEHGIGLTKKRFMPLMFSDTDIAIMRSIKKAFDPNGILNPGKIF